MRRAMGALATLLLAACSGDNSNGTTADAGPDGSKGDGAVQDANGDTGSQDSGGNDAGTDTGADAAGDDGGGDASDGGCPSSWTVAPVVDPSLDVPDGGGGVLMHASASGTQDYTCTAISGDAGTTYKWVFVGPEADLSDCNAVLVGHHFASDGGPTAPEWQTLDGTYVIGSKKAAFTPDGGAASVPWLLLHGVAWGGSGTLSMAQYIQRLNTDGGVAPSSTCDQNNMGTTEKVPYTADYYFYGP